MPGRRASGTAAVGLRPESLTILFDGDSTPGREVRGEVVEVTYYGDMTYYDIALEGAPDVVSVSARNMPGRRVLERGEVTDAGLGSKGADAVLLKGRGVRGHRAPNAAHAARRVFFRIFGKMKGIRRAF
jgi:hypothetical protein